MTFSVNIGFSLTNLAAAGYVESRVGKNPGFFKKTQPSVFFWFFLGFLGFFGFFWFFLPGREGF
jgi:hypothetical protein